MSTQPRTLAIRTVFLQQQELAERAIAQLDAADLFRADSPDDNSVAILMKHVGGNLRSRWTEPFTTDGEKPDRNRDAEFITDDDSADSVRAAWDEGWNTLRHLLDDVAAHDLRRTVTIRGESLDLETALLRSLAHTAQHVGQIVLLARRWRGASWQTLSIPRGGSAAYTKRAQKP
jgi:hypothetical protein